MDHDVIVESLLDRCKRVIENILQAPDLHSVASASLAILAQMRHVARDIPHSTGFSGGACLIESLLM